MSTYQDAGVNIEKGDEASKIAYQAAKNTFVSRKGLIGEPLTDEGGFSGLLDMGDFYLVQNDDGVGTKMIIAEKINKYDTLGYDLICMVADDAICVGAEVISITNTIDVDKVDKEKIKPLMQGLSEAAQEQKIVIPGGEIAELGSMTNGYIWNATAVGVVEKDKVINGKNIVPGDKLIGLYSPGFRSNGFSLVRHILSESFGENYENEKFDERTYAEAALVPSTIYHKALLEIHGRQGEKPKTEIKGIAHITGGGIPGNITRILKNKNLGANITDAFEPDSIVLKLQELGQVDDVEAYQTWNMGVGMIIVSNDTDLIISTLEKHNIQAKIIGEVTEDPKIKVISQGALSKGEELVW
jgi:phosphoribosylformylglycinamidine cyclo-ligase